MTVSRHLLIGLLALAVAPALAASPIGQVKTLTGTVHILRAGERLPAAVGTPVEAADTIVTGANGRVGITFVDDSRFSAGPGTEIALERFSFDSTTHEGRFHSRLGRGTLTVTSGKLVREDPAAMTVQTPSALLGVRGTTFLVRVGERR